MYKTIGLLTLIVSLGTSNLRTESEYSIPGIAAYAGATLLAGAGAYKYPRCTLGACAALMTAGMLAGAFVFHGNLNTLKQQLQELHDANAPEEVIEATQDTIRETQQLATTFKVTALLPTALLIGVIANALSHR